MQNKSLTMVSFPWEAGILLLLLRTLTTGTLCNAFQSSSPPTTTTIRRTQSPSRSCQRTRLPLTLLSMASVSKKGTTPRKRPKPVALNHERDFFRQVARLESMDSYVLVSTLTASMSFGCLLGFSPSVAIVAKANRLPLVFIYHTLCTAIQVVSGLSAIFGLYATMIFSLTILYGKAALGAERDLAYDKFLQRTVRPRVHGARCFTLSLVFFAVEAYLVLMERMFFRWIAVPVFTTIAITAVHLYRDWRRLFRMAEYIYKD